MNGAPHVTWTGGARIKRCISGYSILGIVKGKYRRSKTFKILFRPLKTDTKKIEIKTNRTAIWDVTFNLYIIPKISFSETALGVNYFSL